jgi:L-lactate dehydrogenase (cytochrome)
MSSRKTSPRGLAEHGRASSAFIAVNGVVWDCTGFAETHPGGAGVIRNAWGKDASEVYNKVHSPGLLKSFLGAKKIVGVFDNPGPVKSSSTTANKDAETALQPIRNIINLLDLENAAREVLTERARVYIDDASNDKITARLNQEWFERILFRPRVLRPVKAVDTSVDILGKSYALPIMNAPASLSMMVHPDAEAALARALAEYGTTITIPNMASYSASEILASLPEGHPLLLSTICAP